MGFRMPSLLAKSWSSFSGNFEGTDSLQINYDLEFNASAK
jgi:hypothetical protein